MRIDFHSNVSNYLNYACRLIRKALAAQCKLIVLHQDQAQLTEFDQLLWTFSSTDFLPHASVQHPLAQYTPVLLSLQARQETEPDYLDHKILLNLSERIPDDFTRFERLIEIVPQQQEALQNGRQRYRHYQQQGHQLHHIQAK
jgi:DNA polymerase-3 subunit chi